jgi:hypothetical protein
MKTASQMDKTAMEGHGIEAKDMTELAHMIGRVWGETHAYKNGLVAGSDMQQAFVDIHNEIGDNIRQIFDLLDHEEQKKDLAEVGEDREDRVLRRADQRFQTWADDMMPK